MNLAHLTTDSICVLSFSLIHTLLCGLIDRITWHVRDGRGDVYLLWNTRGTYRHLEVLVGKDWDHFDCQVMMGLLCKFGRQLQEWLRQKCEFHVNYVSQFPWCFVSRRSTLRPKSFKSYFTSGWIKKTSNGQSGQTFQFTHWHLWIRFWCPVTHGLSNNISISRHLSTAQVVLKVCASRWDQKSALEFHGHHWVSTIYRSIATKLICYCMPACYGRNQVRRLSELMNTLSPGGFWVSWFANLSNCKPYLKTSKKWGEKRMPDWLIGGIISDEWRNLAETYWILLLCF